MYFLYGRDVAIRNVFRLVGASADEPVTSVAELRRQYLRFLSDGRFEAPVNTSGELFVTDPKTELALARAYAGGNLDDMEQNAIIGDAFSEADRARRIYDVREAVDHLTFSNPTLASVFDLVIHSIFVRETNRISDGSAAHGGSSSNAIGSIWLSVQEGLSLLDRVELLVHELTHHLLFIDEYCHYHFEYPLISKPENFARSAIRNTRRPLDKVVHSIVVAAELVAARRSLGFTETQVRAASVHPQTAAIVEQTLDACTSVLDELPNLSELVSARTIDLVRRSRQLCQEEHATSLAGLAR